MSRPCLTYCKRGHLLAGVNLYLKIRHRNGVARTVRQCNACRRIVQRDYYKRNPRSRNRLYNGRRSEETRAYYRVWAADMRRMRRLLEVIAYQVAAVEPVGL